MHPWTPSRHLVSTQPHATLVLFPSLGTTTHVWDPVLRELTALATVDVVLFDLPGHGDASPGKEFDIAGLAAAAADVIEGHRRVAALVVGGVSMGAAIAAELASRPGNEVGAVVALNSAVRFGSPEAWNAIIERVRLSGTAASDIDATRDGWFTEAFAAGPGAAVVERLLEDLAAIDAASYVACCEALARYDGRPALAQVTAGGIGIGGSADRATPAAGMREFAALAGLDYAELPGAHLAVVEDAADAARLLDRVLVRAIAHPRQAAA